MTLQMVDLTKRYGEKTAVADLNVTLHTGVYGLLGANGAGKSTLMRLLCTVLKPSGGKILWQGQDIHILGQRYCQVLGYLPQDFGYYPEFCAEDFLLYMAALKGLGQRAARRKTHDLLEDVGLAPYSRAKIKTFSGGMKRRLGIAQAMLNDPHILILDEPTAGLDPKERVRFRNLISQFAKDRIVILSTHIVSDVSFIAEHILLLKGGRLLRWGKPADILADLAGKVWEGCVPEEKAQQYVRDYMVSNLRHSEDGQTILRVVAEQRPWLGAVAVAPNLEDMYLFYFQEEESA